MNTLSKIIAQLSAKSFGATFYFVVLLALSNTSLGQDKKFTTQEYIDKYKNLAIIEMRRTGIPASITLAQGILESSNGNSQLAREANNHFGIKCKKDWGGKIMLLDDDKPQECFRVYEKPEESYYDHSEFISTSKRYAFLFKLDPKDYKGWANGLKEAGYATNPHYPELLISSIETYHLNLFDEPRPIDSTNALVSLNAVRFADSTKDFEFNGLPACIIKHGDSLEAIAARHNISPALLRKYNDLCDWDKPEPGTLLYLKQKAKTGTQSYYVVHNGEGMYMISQMFRIQLKQLYKKNRMECGMQPKPGEKIFLQTKRDSAPELLPKEQIFPHKKEGVNVLKELKDSSFKPDIIIYRKLNLPSFDTSLPKRLDSTLTNLDKNINERAKQPRIHFDTLAKLPKEYKTPEDTLHNKGTMILDQSHSGTGYPPKSLKKDSIIIKRDSLSKRNTDALNTPPQVVKAYNDTLIKNTHNKLDTLPREIHIVKSGETLFSISNKYKISIDSLRAWNHLNGNGISSGKKLRIMPLQTSTNTTAVPDNIKLYHIVQKGETLYSLSVQFKVSINDLKTWNGLNDNAVKLGQKIRVK